MLRIAYNSGVKAALARFKLASPTGADFPVGPMGPELSHGTARTQVTRPGANPAPGEPFDFQQRALAENNSDALWNISEYDKLAPGNTGEWGQEVIG